MINEKQITRWFKVTFSSPSWRSLKPLKGSLNHLKKVTKNHQEYSSFEDQILFFTRSALNNEIVTLPKNEQLAPAEPGSLSGFSQRFFSELQKVSIFLFIHLPRFGFSQFWIHHDWLSSRFLSLHLQKQQNFQVSNFSDPSRLAKHLTRGSYLYSFKNKDFKEYSYTSMCVPSDVCSVDVAGASKGMKLGSSVRKKLEADLWNVGPVDSLGNFLKGSFFWGWSTKMPVLLSKILSKVICLQKSNLKASIVWVWLPLTEAYTIGLLWSLGSDRFFPFGPGVGRWKEHPNGCLGCTGVSLNGGTPKTPQMISCSRKTDGCWVPPFLGNLHIGDEKLPSYVRVMIQKNTT